MHFFLRLSHYLNAPRKTITDLLRSSWRWSWGFVTCSFPTNDGRSSWPNLTKLTGMLTLFLLKSGLLFGGHCYANMYGNWYTSYIEESPNVKFNNNKISVRPRPNVELFMRRTKLSALSSWKVRRLDRLIKFVWMSLDRPTHSASASDGLNAWRSSPGQTSIFTVVTCDEQMNKLISLCDIYMYI